MENLDYMKQTIEKCIKVNLQGPIIINNQISSIIENKQSSIKKSQNNKFKNNDNEFATTLTTNKKYFNPQNFNHTDYKNNFSLSKIKSIITQKQFQSALIKYQERQQKNMLLNQRLKNKIKSLEQTLSKKGVNINNLLSTMKSKNDKQDFWDLELQRIKGQNQILTQQINNISNKLISLTSQNQALKGQFKKITSKVNLGTPSMIQSNYQQEHRQINHHIIFPNSSNNNQTILSGFQQNILLQNFNPNLNIRQTRILNLTPPLQQNLTLRSKIDNNSNEHQSIPSSLTYLPSTGHFQNIQNQLFGEYEKKIQNLSLQLTKKLKQIQNQRDQFQTIQKENKQLKINIEQRQNQMQKINHHCQTLQHDYQISLKKKFELEEKIIRLKQNIYELTQKSNISNTQTDLEINNLRQMIIIKQSNLKDLKQTIQTKLNQQLSLKILPLQKQKQNLQKQMILCRRLLKQSENQYELKLSTLKEQLKKIQKNNQNKDNQIKEQSDKIYQLNKQLTLLNEIRKEQNQQTWKDKYQKNKKQLTKFKKQLKDFKKQEQNLKNQNIKLNQMVTIKAVQINTKIQNTIKQFEKHKFTTQNKFKINQTRLQIMKQTTQHHLKQIFLQQTTNITLTIKDNINQGKKQYIGQIIQKYIESMNNFCLKNAQIKKLKDQIKQLKSKNSNINNAKILKKQGILMPIKQKQPQNYHKIIQQSNQQISQIQKNILQDRLKIQKSIYEEKLLIIQEELSLTKQKLQSKQLNLKETNEQLTKVKRQLKKILNQEKKSQTNSINQSNDQNLQNTIDSLQKKVQRLQSEAKSFKNLNKKVNEQLNLTKTEFMKKKEHIQNMKKQMTTKQLQIQELKQNLKIKGQQNQRLKRQVKDLLTKASLVNQMKQKLEDFNELQTKNQELKKQIQRLSSLHKYQLSKTISELKQLKTDRKIQIQTKIFNKTVQISDELNDLKCKNKKLKSQIDRKQEYIQHIKNKYQSKIQELQNQLNQKNIQLNNRKKQIQNFEKKLDIYIIAQKKYKDKCKLLTVIVKKVYQRLMIKTKIQKQKQKIPTKSFVKQYNNSELIKNTSPIAPVYTSNLFNITSSVKQNLGFGDLDNLKINFQDLQKYSQGLQLFNISAEQLKNLQNGIYDNHNQTSTFSHIMTSPLPNNQKNKSPEKYSNFNENLNYQKNTFTLQKQKQNLKILSESLNQNDQIDVNQIMKIFEDIIES